MQQYQDEFDFFPMEDDEELLGGCQPQFSEHEERQAISLRDYQEACISGDDKFRGVFGEWDAGNDETCIILPTGCHDPDQLLLMHDGSLVAAHQVRIDDDLMGPDSGRRRVVALHSGRMPMYRVIPTKGDPFDVTENHTLSLVRVKEKNRDRYKSDRRSGEIVDVSVTEWVNWPKWRKHIYKLYRVGVDFPSRMTFGFDPYFAGVLLGDGSLVDGRSVGVTTEDHEIESECYRVALRYGLHVRVEPAGGLSETFYLAGTRGPGGNSLIHALRRVGLWGMDCGTKSIPDVFLCGDRRSRLLILAGLIDTDGSLSGSNGYDFVSKSPRLSHDVAYLSRSLGMAAYVSACRKCDQYGTYGTYYRVSISGNTEEIPVKIARKKAVPRYQIKSVLRTGFRVEPIGVGDYCGVTVDRDHRYLMGDFTVTHNCGKTIVFGSIIRRYGERYGLRSDGKRRRSLVLAHRDYLLRQAADTLAGLGVHSAIEKAELRARESIFGMPDCVVASVQSMQSNKRSKRRDAWPEDDFDLIVTDEGHHKDADSYQAVYNHFKGAKHRLLVTATPDAIDVESLAYEYSMLDAVKAGWLCPIRVVRCDTQIDLSQIRTTAGDLNQHDIEKAIAPYIEILANAIKQEISDRKTIVFTPDVGSAEAMATALCDLGIPTESMSAKTPDNQRLDILDGFRSGQFQCLTNCAMFTEGFDVPSVSAIVLLRPTKSRPLFVQMVGRGTRPKDPNGKHHDLIVVDFPWNAGKHKLVKPTELFDRTTESSDLYKEAQRILDIGETDDLTEAITRAEDVLTERMKFKVRAAEKRARYRRFVYDPLEVGEILKIPKRPESDRVISVKASEKQVEMLTRWGIVGAAGMSRKRASIFIGKLIERREAGLATYKQIAHLIAQGIEPKEARLMKFEDASAKLSELFRR